MTFAVVQCPQSELKQPQPDPRGQRVLEAWPPPCLLLVPPVELLCLCPPAPHQPSSPSQPLFSRGRHLLSYSGCLQPTGLHHMRCWTCVLKAHRAAPLQPGNKPNAGWELTTVHLQAATTLSGVTAILNSPLRPKGVATRPTSSAPFRKAQTLTQRAAIKLPPDRLGRRTAVQQTGCPKWAKRWKAVKKVSVFSGVPSALKNKMAGLILHP